MENTLCVYCQEKCKVRILADFLPKIMAIPLDKFGEILTRYRVKAFGGFLDVKSPPFT